MSDNEEKIHTFTIKDKTGVYKLMVFFEIGVTCLLLFFGYIFVSKLQNQTPSKTSSAKQIDTTTPIATPTKFEVPHSYEILSITKTDMTLRGDEGEMVLPTSGPEIALFKGTPKEHTDASINDVRVGQKVILEIIPGERVWVYIL